MTKKVKKLIEQFFKSGKYLFEKQEIKDYKDLLRSEVLIIHSTNDSLIEINPYSKIVNETIFNYCKEIINFDELNTIEEVANVISSFRDKLKEKNELKNHRPFSPVMDGFHGYLLNSIQNRKSNVYSYAFDKIKLDSGEEDNSMNDFDKAFVYHLLSWDYSIDKVFEFCQISTQSNNHTIWSVLHRALLRQTNSYIKSLYEHGKSEELIQSDFQLRLYPIAFDHYPNEVFRFLMDSTVVSTENKLTALARCNLSQEQIEDVLETLNEFEISESNFLPLNDFCYFMVQNISASRNERERIYLLWRKLILKAHQEQLAKIIYDLGLIDNEEDEDLRYLCLVAYVNRTGKLSVVDNFFGQFRNPWFLFKIIADTYQAAEGRKYHIAARFRRSLEHFFQINPEESEKCILELFRSSHGLGTLPVDVMMVKFSSAFNIDLCLLENEEDQLNAIHRFYYVSHNFEKVLPSLISLWKSKYSAVVVSLQSHLAALTYDTYGQDMLDWVIPMVKGKGSRKFVVPIKEAAKQRKQDLQRKFDTNDINPAFHEKELLQTYLALSQENQSKAMKESQDNPSFLRSMFKTSIIVRGNSAKMGCHGEVTKLGSVSVSSTVDSRPYKNPDLFEFNLRNVR